MIALALLGLAAVLGADVPPARTVSIPSTKDGAAQPALFYAPPESKKAVPLLVHLHSWSSDYKAASTMREALKAAEERGWAFISPDFRGPNNRPEACGSPLAVQDVLDAVAYARKHARIDRNRIYLLGGSGGGHMSLLMSARAPKVWAAVSAWVPITDLAAWHSTTKAAGLRYAGMLDQCCGGAPGSSAAADKEYRERSPLFYLERAKGVKIDIQAGIHDGHNKESVPVRHSLEAFNRLAEANGYPKAKFSAEEIDVITRTEKLPEGLSSEPTPETGRRHVALFRRTAGPVRITIFDGPHASDFPASIPWLAEQRK